MTRTAWVPPPLPDVSEDDLLQTVEAICRKELAANVYQPELLHLRALIAFRRGEDDSALACLTRAAELGLPSAALFLDLASVLARKGRGAEAISACLHAMRLGPGDPNTYRQLGRTLYEQGRHNEAAAACKESLRLRPDDSTAMSELGDVLHVQGRWTEALECYQTALRMRPGDVDIYVRLGELRLSRREWALAMDTFGHGLQLDGNRADLHAGIGQALVRLGKLEDALAAFRTALAINPTDINACRQFVFASEASGAGGAAGWLHLGAALEACDRLAEAAAAYRQALARRDNCLQALIGLGSVHLMMNEPADAIRRYQAAVAIAPKHPVARFKLGWAHHLAGDPERGWDEFRWLCHPHLTKAWRAFEQPLWDGSPLAGKTILLWAGNDYGLGDTIHLVRYARAARERGARVIVECQQRLVPLVQGATGVDRAVTRGAPLPRFDVQAPLMWVPIVDSGTRPPAYADAPYLSVEQHSIDCWRQRLGPSSGPTVGLSWGGKTTRRDARYRFAPLSALAPLANTPNVRFVSLQMGSQADELFNPPYGLRIETLQDESCSIADAAALILNLHLVITVDTMIAHLAGALAKPVWTVLPFAADWKWPDRDCTHWYPTMRLFRQTRPGDWRELFERVRVALDAWAASV